MSELEIELRKKIRGEVLFDQGNRGAYATDASNYRQAPIGVVIPLDAEDVEETIAVCRSWGAPVLPRGGGTSLAGQCCNHAVILDFTKFMNRVMWVDAERKLARVQPGSVLDSLRARGGQVGLTFGPDPATHTHCTLGGMIGNNSCGVHAQMAGRTVENIRDMEILTYDGLRMRVGITTDFELERILRQGGRRAEIYSALKGLRDRYAQWVRAEYPRIPRRVSGYNLDALLPENGFNVARALVGSEGTLVTVLDATVELVDDPPHRSLVVLGYPSVFEAGDHVSEVLSFRPIGLEGMDEKLVSLSVDKGISPEARRFLPQGQGWLLVEFGGENREEAKAKAEALVSSLGLRSDSSRVRIYADPERMQEVWDAREAGLGATARGKEGQENWPGWEDSAVPPERIGFYLRDLRKLFEKFGYDGALYGHFGEGCVHVRIGFDLVTDPGIEKFRSFIGEASDLVIAHGGSLSGEHGDGQARAEFLDRMYSPELLKAFREFKSIWDPQGKMNPGKIVDPFPVDTNLRVGTDYNPLDTPTYFQFPEDHGSFAKATLKCVGIGKCRKAEGATMCPSFRVTHDEKHTTRGRARILFEMLQGDIVKEGWGSEAVKEALDLCLACKGCKRDCPVNVDMATYKSEFLAHYYQKKRRPRSAYAFGFIDRWAELASVSPGLANFFTQNPGLSAVSKRIAGAAPQRAIPKFAKQTFKSWFFSRQPRLVRGKKVVLWADTFNNYFHPEVARDAVETLESLGFHPVVPRGHLCCGRPLYDYGFLDEAKHYLRRVLHALRDEIRQGTPVVGLEPSCVSVFRDELRGLMPHNQDGRRLSELVVPFAEFILREVDEGSTPRLHQTALVHGHCHHKADYTMSGQEQLLKRMGVDAQILDSGCCGMAGSFGFEHEGEKYDVSMKVGERVLLPAVRSAPESALILSDGFSCRSQITGATDRRPIHIAQLMNRAIQGKGNQ